MSERPAPVIYRSPNTPKRCEACGHVRRWTQPECPKCRAAERRRDAARRRDRELRWDIEDQVDALPPVKAAAVREWFEFSDHRRAVAARMQARCRRYGITVAEWAWMVVEQRSRCALCQTSHEDDLTRLSVDHDHTSGVVRGLLCRSCNTGLGHLGIDGPDARGRTERIISYLAPRTVRHVI